MFLLECLVLCFDTFFHRGVQLTLCHSCSLSEMSQVIQHGEVIWTRARSGADILKLLVVSCVVIVHLHYSQKYDYNPGRDEPLPFFVILLLSSHSDDSSSSRLTHYVNGHTSGHC